MWSPRAALLVTLVVLSLLTAPLTSATAAPPTPEASPGAEQFRPDAQFDRAPASASAPVDGFSDVADDRLSDIVDDELPGVIDEADRTSNATTSETIGYVNGHWYDDELDVDPHNLRGDDLDAVVYRSMARVEVIRNLTFQEEVPVEVRSRDEFEEETDELFGLTDDERLELNAQFEALFMVDRETDAVEEYRSLYGGAVAGYYQIEEERIVIVSDDVDAPAMDELTLGHELTHALQDQHFDLERFDGDTHDASTAEDGLVEGDANLVEHLYDGMCEESWDCVRPDDEESSGGANVHWGIYFMIYQPYSDGPSFVLHLRDAGGWEAVNDAYENPPAGTAEVIHPEAYGERDFAEIDREDRSTDRWSRLEPTGTGSETIGEAGMASMLAYPTLQTSPFFGGEDLPATVDEPLVPLARVLNFEADLSVNDFNPQNYDYEYTDGWAGDRLVTYVTDERTIDETGYVWHTEWLSEDDAAEFVDGYTWLLEYHGAEPVAGHEHVFVVDDGYPGAYYLDHDGTAVDIVRAPSLGGLSELYGGAAPDIDDEENEGECDGEECDDDREDGDREDGDREDDDREDDDGSNDRENDDGERDADGGDGDDGTGDDSADGADDDTESADGEDDADSPSNSSDVADDLPGFGVGVALCGVLIGALFLTRRR